MSNQTPREPDQVIAELTAIKRLLAFQLLRSGVSQADVGAALGIAQSAVSRMFPPKKLKLAGAKKA